MRKRGTGGQGKVSSRQVMSAAAGYKGVRCVNKCVEQEVQYI